MKSEEANKIIAEYMGISDYNNSAAYPNCTAYYESLDALVPVWGKLGWFNKTVVMRNNDLTDNKCSYEIAVKKGFFDAQAENYQEAAAIATAKAIRELTPKEED